MMLVRQWLKGKKKLEFSKVILKTMNRTVQTNPEKKGIEIHNNLKGMPNNLDRTYDIYSWVFK